MVTSENATKPRAPSNGSARGNADVTRLLLACGIAAGPFYVAVGASQALLREGFDPTRHALSLLSLGEMGWVQVANFIITGALVIAGAAGVRRALAGSRGGLWGPILLSVYGLGLIGAGIFVPDPAPDFPPRAAGAEATSGTLHGLLHFACGGLGFLALIAACFVLTRRFAGLGERSWAFFSAATGVLFFAGFAGIASGGGSAALNIAFTVAVLVAWTWLSLVSWKIRSEVTAAA